MKDIFELEKLELKNLPDIKSVRTQILSAYDRFGDTVSGSLLDYSNSFYSDKYNYLVEFDQKCREIKRTYYNSDDSISRYIEEIYNGDLRIETIYKVLTVKPNNLKSYRIEYTYDNKNCLSKSVTYDDKNQISKIEIHKSFKNSSPSEINTYDSNGFLIKKVVYTTDAVDNIISLKQYSNRGNLQISISYLYNNNILHKILITDYTRSSDYRDTTEILNNEGLLISTSNDVTNYKYKYSDDKFLLETNIFSNKGIGETIVFKYETDRLGNWVKRTHFRNEIPFINVERCIEYR